MTKELEGVRAMLTVPTYGQAYPACQKALRVAMMSASNHGLSWAGDVSSDKLKFSDTRNKAAQALYDSPKSADGILWVDSDIVLEPDSILKLMHDVKVNGLDFVTGVYHKKAPPYDPVIYAYEPDTDKYLVVEQFKPGFCVPVGPHGGACGFGFCWTSTKMIQAIAAMKCFTPEGKWFPDTRDMPKDWRGPDGRPGYGEDFSFSDKARRAGFILYVDTGCLLGHTGGEIVYDRSCYLKWLSENGGHIKVPDRMCNG